MFTRSILLPTLIACVIAAPFIFSSAKQASQPDGPNAAPGNLAGYATYGNSGAYLPNVPISGLDPSNPFHQTGSSTNYQNAPIGNPAFYLNGRIGEPINPALTSNQSVQTGFGNPGLPSPQIRPQNPLPRNESAPVWMQTGVQPELSGLTPDFGASRTLVFPGDANGPDLSQPPMEFIPVMNFEEIFRFDVAPNWVKGRWKRVSTSPGSNGLHGFRVALVTGTNSWDLHGSLTYFFDQNQRAERITFRGWTGDASQLLKLLTEKLDFKTQPTQLAGFYLAKSWGKPTGGLLMQDPTVIYAENPVQQVALVLEINNPRGKFSLSEEFQSLIEGSQNER